MGFASANGIGGDQNTSEVKADEKRLEIADSDNQRSLCRISRFMLDEQQQIDKSALELETFPDSTGTLLSIKSKTIRSASEGWTLIVGFILHSESILTEILPVRFSMRCDHFDGTFRELSRPENVSIFILTINWHFPFRSAVEFKLRKKMKRLILLRQRFRPYCRLIPTFRVAAFLGAKTIYWTKLTGMIMCHAA